MRRYLLALLIAVWTGSPTWAINGDALPLNSGSDSGTTALLNNNGYAGAYVTLAAPGPVTITVNAQGTSFGGIDPHLNLVVNDTKMGWDVGAAATNYQQTLDLPAGTHFVRAEFNNDLATSRALTINSLDVSGATINLTNTNAVALAAAQTYTANYRKGPAKLALVGVAPGTQIDVKLKRHAFNFGTTVPNSFTDTLLINNPAPNTDAARFQQALVANRFNSLSAENGAKWDANEGTRDVLTSNAVNPNGGPNIPYMDRISDFAEAHDMGYRQHNLIWGTNANGNNNQQPTWSHTMVQNPTAIDPVSGKVNSEALRDEISERVDYFVQDRATRFYEVDVYNESYHTGSNHPNAALTYWDTYGASGIAAIYKEVKDAIAAGGGNAGAFVNEYSVLQNQGGDYYANWYARHTEDIQNAGKVLYGPDENVVTGIGFQYYAGTNLANHSAARIYATMQNLAVQGLPMALTEWGVTGTDSAANEATAATILEETVRLVFGMPDTTGMTLWNLRNVSGVFAPVGTLYDTNWTIRDTGTRWQQLMSEWDTHVTPTVNVDGTIDFNGFYGDYTITVGSQTYNLSLTKGDALYSLVIAAGDYNADGTVDAADYTVWRDTLGSTDDLRADGNGNEIVDSGDYEMWQSLFGTVYSAGVGAAATVPEPSSVAILLMGVTMLLGKRPARMAELYSRGILPR